MTTSIKIVPKAPNSVPKPLVVALAYDGLCTFEFGVAVEVFGLARPEIGQDWYQFAVCAIESGPLKAAGGVQVVAKKRPRLLETAHTIIVPGWRGDTTPVPPFLIKALRTAHRRGTRIVSFCSGVFVLAAAGLLDGRKATTHWRYTEKLSSAFPAIKVDPNALYIDEGDVLTAAGTAAAIDLCLHLIRKDYGAAAANLVARRLVVPPHREGGQAQFIDRPVPIAREGVRLSPLLDRIRKELHQQHSIASLAAESGMSARTFLRRFKAATGTTPGDWILTERLANAKDLLEGTKHGIDDIAGLCGFGSTATLRHHFRERLGINPAAYRAQFSHARK